MLSRPTTEQILLDCCRELMTGVFPTVTDETAQVKLIMLDTVLRNMAERSAHEIAWMCEEIASIEAFVEARARLAKAPHADLNLDAVVESYCRAGDALSAALEAVVASGAAGLLARGDELLHARAERETVIMAGWSPTGR